MTSVLSYWLSGKALFFCYISAIPPGWSGGSLTPLQYTLLSSLNKVNVRALPILIFQHCLPLTKPLTYTLSPHIYLRNLHLIYPPHIPTVCISFIPPYVPAQPGFYLSLHIYLYSLHLIYRPNQQLTPTTYTACISFIPQINS